MDPLEHRISNLEKRVYDIECDIEIGKKVVRTLVWWNRFLTISIVLLWGLYAFR